MSTVTADERELALKRYGQILGYMQYENSVFWTRSQLFLAAHAFLFGFVLTKVPVTGEEATWARLYTLAVACAAGILLGHLWRRALHAGLYWISHWRTILREIEPAAYDAHLIHRDFPRAVGYVSATGVASQTSWLFLGLWYLTIGYIGFMAIAKCAGWVIL